VLGKRIPFHDNLKLANWYGNERGRDRWRSLHYRLLQAVAYLQLFDALDIIGRSGEAARLSGVELSQSFPGIRGSQYKVEGVLLRALQSLNSNERGSKKGRHMEHSAASLTADSKSQTQSPWKVQRNILPTKHEISEGSDAIHQLNDRCYYFFSPSLRDANKQEALEVQALTLEPKSGHLKDPVVVCDFTALYPSLVIAYNLCYSTCAGKLDYHSTREEMRQAGRTTGKVGPMQVRYYRNAFCVHENDHSLVLT
jgi:DNA polymerase elongation subunit (family B)